jgi:hypothetical protein
MSDPEDLTPSVWPSRIFPFGYTPSEVSEVLQQSPVAAEGIRLYLQPEAWWMDATGAAWCTCRHWCGLHREDGCDVVGCPCLGMTADPRPDVQVIGTLPHESAVLLRDQANHGTVRLVGNFLAEYRPLAA